MKFLFSAAFAVLVGLTSATTRNVDKTAFQNFYDSFGGADWATCEGTTSDPCTLCSWVGCDGDNKITSIEIPNNEYTGTTIVLKAGKIHAFSAIERFTVGSGNSYTYDVSLACVDFEGANDNKCGNTDELYGFCCFQKALIDFFDLFPQTASAWTKCGNRRTTLCDCNPSGDSSKEVTCTNGVLDTLKLRNNNLHYDQSISALANVLQDLLDYGATSVDLGGNGATLIPTDACPFIPACNNGLSCNFPFTTCTPTGAPTTPEPTKSPTTPQPTRSPHTSSPTKSPVTCDSINSVGGIRKVKKVCNNNVLCTMSGGVCVTATPVPTLSPTTPTIPPECTDIQGRRRSKVQSACLEQSRCAFSAKGRKNLCFQLRDGNGDIPCDNVNNFLSKAQRQNNCPSECGFESGKKHGNSFDGRDPFGGYCFEIAACSDANRFKPPAKRKAACDVLGNSCSYDENTRICEDAAP